MYGFYNMVLRINLSQQSFELKMVSDQILRTTLGGEGLAAHLFHQSKPDRTGKTPHDHLIFATGPVTGTIVPGSLCCGVFIRSPEIGYCADYFKGPLVECMTGTGFDAVLVNGVSDRPVWIEVGEEGGSFHSGAELLGCDAVGAAKRIEAWMREHQPAVRKFGLLCIGDDGIRTSDLLMPGVELLTIDRESDMARLLRADKVVAIVFLGGKKRVLAHPELIKRFSSRSRGVPGGGEPSVSSGVEKRERANAFVNGGAEFEYRSTIHDSLIIRDSSFLYEWEDLGALIKGATGLELGEEALRVIARSVKEDIGHLT